MENISGKKASKIKAAEKVDDQRCALLAHKAINTNLSQIYELHSLAHTLLLTGLCRRLETRFLRLLDGVDCWGDWIISPSRHSPSTGLCWTGVPLGVGVLLIFLFPVWNREEGDRKKTEKKERIGKAGPGEIAGWGASKKEYMNTRIKQYVN